MPKEIPRPNNDSAQKYKNKLGDSRDMVLAFECGNRNTLMRKVTLVIKRVIKTNLLASNENLKSNRRTVGSIGASTECVGWNVRDPTVCTDHAIIQH